MEAQKVPDSLLFKAVVYQILEVDPSMSIIQILDMLIDGDLAEYCDYYYFYSDDDQIDEEEEFLLNWIKSMAGNVEARKKLTPIARKMSRNRY